MNPTREFEARNRQMVAASREAVKSRAHASTKNSKQVILTLDSNHTHEHVLAELEAYVPFTSVGGCRIVSATIVDDLPDAAFRGRPWGNWRWRSDSSSINNKGRFFYRG